MPAARDPQRAWCGIVCSADVPSSNIRRRATGSERFHVHQMRHAFACQWLERGGGLAALQQIFGHASIATTQRYAKLTDEVVMREAERIALESGAAR